MQCLDHPRFGLFLGFINFLLTGIYFDVFFRYSDNYGQVKVVSLNVWGMPVLLGGGEYKTERMEAIADQIGQGDYDVFLMQELWLQADHQVLSRRLPTNYVMTAFRQLSLSTCDGRVSPWGCSGLAVVSRHNFTEIEFNSFTYHGDGTKALIDGEVLAKKGVGRVRIMPLANVTVDIFVTHTAADPNPNHGYDNSYYRLQQIKELLQSFIVKSDADIVILGGDFNTEPDTKKGSPYQLIQQSMTNCVQEIYYKFDEWLSSNFATYGNAKNTFTGGKEHHPVIYDYIFHRSNKKQKTESWTSWFQINFLQTTIKNNTETSEISVSDHQSIESIIHFRKI